MTARIPLIPARRAVIQAVNQLEVRRFPSLQRRGGRDIKRWRAASFDGADGVVAHTAISCERPPRLRRFGGCHYLTGAASPPLQGGDYAPLHLYTPIRSHLHRAP